VKHERGAKNDREQGKGSRNKRDQALGLFGENQPCVQEVVGQKTGAREFLGVSCDTWGEVLKRGSVEKGS